MSEPTVSLILLLQSAKWTRASFGSTHLSTAQALHQLTQALFLSGDMVKAQSTASEAHSIFLSRLGAEHSQTLNAARNVELLIVMREGVERQKEAGEAMKTRRLERLHAATGRVGKKITPGSVSSPAGLLRGNGNAMAGSSRAVMADINNEVTANLAGGVGEPSSGVNGLMNGSAGGGVNGSARGVNIAVDGTEPSRTGEKGHLEVDELVKFIQGGPTVGSGRGTKGLRGKRRTGAKR